MLVSIIVITYNSELYVKETLESILKQTYQNLEIILSDDCSTDSTPDILKEFARRYSKRFAGGVKYTQTLTNSGIVGNYNHALKFAKGEWIKYIAGDDRLKPNCIDRFVNNVNPIKDTFLICYIESFHNRSLSKEIVNYDLLDAPTAEEQLINVITLSPTAFICGCTFFIHKETLIKLGNFDTNYPMIEDYPIGLKYLSNGYKIKLIKEPLIEYRVYPQSVSNSSSAFIESLTNSIKKELLPIYIKKRMYFHWYHHRINLFIYKHNHKNLFYNVSGYILRLFDIINYQNKIKHFKK